MTPAGVGRGADGGRGTRPASPAGTAWRRPACVPCCRAAPGRADGQQEHHVHRVGSSQRPPLDRPGAAGRSTTRARRHRRRLAVGDGEPVPEPGRVRLLPPPDGLLDGPRSGARPATARPSVSSLIASALVVASAARCSRSTDSSGRPPPGRPTASAASTSARVRHRHAAANWRSALGRTAGRRSPALTAGIRGPATLISSSPSPTSTGRAAGTSASSPHRPTHLPRAWAPSTTVLQQPQDRRVRPRVQRRPPARCPGRRPGSTASGRCCRC